MDSLSGRSCQAVAFACMLLAGLSGCSTGSGSRFGFSSGPHRMSESAKELREASGPPPGIPRELDKQMAVPYVIEPGDVLLVQPASLDSPVRLPGDQVVLPDGTIQIGKFGHLIVAGKTLEMIEAEVNAIIKGKALDAGTIIVRLVTRDSKVFYVLGEVNAPGAFPLRGRETVLDAILAGGGLTNNASRRNIILTRPTTPQACRLVLPVLYNDIVQVGDTTTNYQIQAGDRVFVPTRGSFDDLCRKKKEKNACNPHTTCVPRDGMPVVSMSKPMPAPTLPPAHMESPAFLGQPVPPGLPAPDPVPPMPSADSEPKAPVWTPPAGYQPLKPPGG